MPRIAGINIPEKKRIEFALTSIFGIGLSLSRKILAEAKIKAGLITSQLKPEEVSKLKEIIEKKYKIEGGLKREIMMNIKRLREIGSWRGTRHIKGLPVRGQRTRTNTRTVRGNVRKTMGSGRRPSSEPT
ncbi:30S ribosomal protein S13 [Patescibacteria group bacterium]